jgi:hypothetical protein
MSDRSKQAEEVFALLLIDIIDEVSLVLFRINGISFKYEETSKLPHEARGTQEKIREPSLSPGFHRLDQKQHIRS